MKLSWKDCLKAGISIFVLYLAIHYWQNAAELAAKLLSASVPLIIGLVVAYLVNIVMSAYERKWFVSGKSPVAAKLRRPVCMLLAFLTLLAILGLVVGLVVPQLKDCVRLIISALPGFMEKLIALAEELKLFSPEVLSTLDNIDWNAQITKLVGFVTSGMGSVVSVVVGAVSSLFSFLVTALLSLIFSIYLLAEKETLLNQMDRLARRYLRDRIYKNVCYVARILDDCFHRYIVGQCLEAVILGALCVVGMAVLRIPYALMVGALVAFTALIPVAGAYIGAGVGAFMILMVDPLKALVFLVFLVILQQLEGNLIYPRVVGSSMGLPGIWVLAAVTVGGGLLGVVGMLLGVPLAAAVYRIIQTDVRKYERARREASQSAPVPETDPEEGKEA